MRIAAYFAPGPIQSTMYESAVCIRNTQLVGKRVSCGLTSLKATDSDLAIRWPSVVPPMAKSDGIR